MFSGFKLEVNVRQNQYCLNSAVILDNKRLFHRLLQYKILILHLSGTIYMANLKVICVRWSMLILGLHAFSINAQDPVFSQYYNSPIQLNPAFAGNNPAPYVSLNYRIQWPGVPSAYNTFAIGYDQFFKSNQIGLGLSLLSDSAGDGALKATKGSGMFSYKLKVNKSTYIKGGVEIGFVQKRLDWQKLIFGDAIDPFNGNISPGGTPYPTEETQPGNTTRYYIDMGSGLLLYNDKFFVGGALQHINTPKDNFLQGNLQNYNDLPIRYVVHAGWQILLSKNSSGQSFISPNVLLTGQSGFFQINGGAYLSSGALFGGLWYRHSGINGDAVIASFGVRTGALKIGYSFDYTISDLNIRQGGAHEIGIALDLKDYFPKESEINDCLLLFR